MGNIFNMSPRTRTYPHRPTLIPLMYLVLNILFEKLIRPSVIGVKTKSLVLHWHAINCETIVGNCNRLDQGMDFHARRNYCSCSKTISFHHTVCFINHKFNHTFFFIIII